MRLSILAAAAAAALSLTGAAQAQQSNPADMQLVSKYNLPQMAGIFQELGLTVGAIQLNNGTPALRVQTPSGNVFIAYPRICDNAQQASGCAMISLVAGFSNLPTPLEQINEFHRTDSLTSMVIKSSNGGGSLNNKVLTVLGVTRLHVKGQVARFLSDADTFYTKYVRGSTSNAFSVSLDPDAGHFGVKDHPYEEAITYSGNGASYMTREAREILADLGEL
ncbi:hypothetical protein HK107_04435 [Parvularcula sp. ZS-1/3]|uniref:Uncharacterized protein n=1 Tax=Parvularcula mediterranea TaxID=2732508 RepID=A0A7Y3RKA7_9PROT|nr:hypothetical protein [Parvularcula mediterranea]NNU15565.1 hypothetical protein [Parvularcula mediterranea]